MSKILRTRNLVAFIYKKLGFKGKDHVSPYQLASTALAMDGIEKDDVVSYKKFVENNAEHILKSIGKKKKIKIIDKKEMKRNTSNFEANKSKEFLSTYEWRKLRMEAIKKYGNSCQCCGASPKNGAVLNVDHIKPRKFFPHLALDINNLQILCAECNHGKGNWDQTDWRQQ